MAAYREHISVSGVLGVVYGAGAVMAFGFRPVEGILAACLGWIAGMLPDLDAESGRPVREIFSLLAAAGAVILPTHLGSTADPTTTIVLAIGVYAVIRYGGALLLSKLAVHRGMFHSVPALLIAAEVVFLVYVSPDIRVKLLMAGSVALGFLSHLVLDEIYSVEWSGVAPRLNQAAGSALKLFGKGVFANMVTFALLAVLSYAVASDLGWLQSERTVPDFPGIRGAIDNVFRRDVRR